MKYNVIKIIIHLMVLLCFGEQYNESVIHNETKLARALKVEPKQIIGNYDPSLKPLPPPKTGYDQHVISVIPDFRSTAGSAGKNIVFAEDGQNVAVIYNRFSSDSTNFMKVYVAYSTDRGNYWIHFGPLSALSCRRTYPGLDAEPHWPDPNDMRVHFVRHEAAQISGAYDSSPCFYAKEVSYPDGLITGAFRLPNSGTWDIWHPCIAVKDNYLLITGVNGGQFFTNDGYIWRSTDYGETWDNGRLFFPGPLDWMSGPHFRFGSDGYVFFLWNRQEEGNPAIYWPYYCESFDYGLTWTSPQLIWQNNPPYTDMTQVTGWWYDYDCEVVNDTPVATLKLSTEGNDYGEIWAYRPDGGSPGSWHFVGTKLVGGDSTAPQSYARYPTVAADDRGDIFIGYQAIFMTPTDTGPDVGMFWRYHHTDRWLYRGRITHNFGTIEEKMLEFAHNVPTYGSPPFDTAVIGFIYNNAGDYPTTGNLFFDYVALPFVPGISEENHLELNKLDMTTFPNPFRNSVKFSLPLQLDKIKLMIFDATGKLVRELTTKNQQLTTDLIWDSRKSDGSLANQGVYFYNISSIDAQTKGKIILMR
jgi:FlgD Ig-like domain